MLNYQRVCLTKMLEFHQEIWEFISHKICGVDPKKTHWNCSSKRHGKCGLVWQKNHPKLSKFIQNYPKSSKIIQLIGSCWYFSTYGKMGISDF